MHNIRVSIWILEWFRANRLCSTYVWPVFTQTSQNIPFLNNILTWLGLVWLKLTKNHECNFMHDAKTSTFCFVVQNKTFKAYFSSYCYVSAQEMAEHFCFSEFVEILYNFEFIVYQFDHILPEWIRINRPRCKTKNKECIFGHELLLCFIPNINARLFDLAYNIIINLLQYTIT